MQEAYSPDNQGLGVTIALFLPWEEGLVVLIDSTVGPRSSPLFMLYSIAERGDDDTLFFSHIQYKDLKDAMDNAPHWIKPEALKSRAAQMLPQEFAQQHLNQWTSGHSSLFPPDVLDKCRDKYRLDPKSIAGNAAYIVGAGLDRAYVNRPGILGGLRL